jgi:hypothetical protein
MSGSDRAKPITAERFKSICIQARDAAEGQDECSLLHSLCRAMIEDLGDPSLVSPPESAGTTGLMDAILCDYLVHRYQRENGFDPFPIIQNYLLSSYSPVGPLRDQP